MLLFIVMPLFINSFVEVGYNTNHRKYPYGHDGGYLPKHTFKKVVNYA